MENYIVINGVTYDLVERAKAVKAPESEVVAGTKLRDVAVKDTIKIGKHEFVVLEHSGDTTAVILKEPLFKSKEFGKNNNYNGSYVDGECNKFADEIAALIGKENLVEHTVDLTSGDGLKDYGKIRRRASLLTADLYRRYVEALDVHKIDKWWWLATAYSAPGHNHTSWVKCVAPSGRINNDNYYGDGGVRPFCILKSNIFVSM